jgi:ribosomal protein S27E
MPDFITLSCPSCGHKLQITDDIDRFACAECGNEHIVIRSGGVVALKPVMIDNASQSDDIMRQLLRDTPNAFDIDTPAKRKRFEELLDQFKKEMDAINEAEAKQPKDEE